jgi:hypothetical protein
MKPAGTELFLFLVFLIKCSLSESSCSWVDTTDAFNDACKVLDCGVEGKIQSEWRVYPKSEIVVRCKVNSPATVTEKDIEMIPKDQKDIFEGDITLTFNYCQHFIFNFSTLTSKFPLIKELLILGDGSLVNLSDLHFDQPNSIEFFQLDLVAVECVGQNHFENLTSLLEVNFEKLGGHGNACNYTNLIRNVVKDKPKLKVFEMTKTEINYLPADFLSQSLDLERIVLCENDRLTSIDR